MHESAETTAIRKRMQEVRRDLDEDVQEIVEGARDMGEWRTYVKSYPWVCLGAALALGYWGVPRRRLVVQPDSQTLAELANQSRLVAESNKPPKGTARGMLLGFVGNLVLRGAMSFAQQQAVKLLASHAVEPQDDQP